MGKRASPFFYFFYLFLGHLTFGGEEATILFPYYLQMAKGNKNGNKSPFPSSLLAAAFQQVVAAASKEDN